MERTTTDAGPDPIYGLSVGIIGLVVMALGGARTWHYVFNIGEGVMLLGAAMFLISVAVTSLKLDPLRERLPSWLGGPKDDDASTADGSEDADDDDDDDDDEVGRSA